jgi:hypothetical protein
MRKQDGTNIGDNYTSRAFSNAVPYGTENRADPVARAKGYEGFSKVNLGAAMAGLAADLIS